MLKNSMLFIFIYCATISTISCVVPVAQQAEARCFQLAVDTFEACSERGDGRAGLNMLLVNAGMQIGAKGVELDSLQKGAILIRNQYEAALGGTQRDALSEFC